MPTTLSDPPFSLYAILAAILLIAGAVWFNRRTRRSLAVFLSIAFLLLVLWAIDRLYESPREAAVRGVQEIQDAINERNWAAFESHISKDFKYRAMNRAELREKMSSVVNAYNARAAVWEFNRDKVRQNGENEIEIVFDAKGDPKNGAAYYCHLKATFIREADGEWRLKTFAVYNYASKTNGPEDVIPNIE